ncbi:MAG: polysaccharide biosynthesis/export family protein [Muribaculaceae bacterium]|nr:polysaccharide biosynthesis/export family protein [Muribaculaceae bacterium]
MKSLKLLTAAALALTLGACSTPQLGYFQGVQSGQSFDVSKPVFATFQPGDKLSILVSSKDPSLAYVFNLPVVGNYRPNTEDNPITNRVSNYTIDQDGTIDFPVLGKIHIAGMTRREVADYIKNQLVTKELLKDPTITIEPIDLTYGVMGEVKSPGRYAFDHDKLTLLDALSRSGDLTIYGQRENVLVARTENGKQTYYRVDLTNADQLYASPVFYLRPNDIIYIEPNKRRAKESSEVGNTLAQPTLWVSVASLLTSVAVLIFRK